MIKYDVSPPDKYYATWTISCVLYSKKISETRVELLKGDSCTVTLERKNGRTARTWEIDHSDLRSKTKCTLGYKEPSETCASFKVPGTPNQFAGIGDAIDGVCDTFKYNVPCGDGMKVIDGLPS